MLLCSEVGARALSQLGRLGAGRDPRSVDAETALEALKGLYQAWLASGAFGRLSDVIPSGAEYTAGENQRIFRNSEATVSVTLPDTVPAYSSPRSYRDEVVSYEAVDGNNRPPRHGSVVVIVDSEAGTSSGYIYNGELRSWQRITALELADPAPLSEDGEGLAANVAVEISDQFGLEPTQSTLMKARRFLGALTQRFSTPREAMPGVFC